jgi:hypothetical protein
VIGKVREMSEPRLSLQARVLSQLDSKYVVKYYDCFRGRFVHMNIKLRFSGEPLFEGALLIVQNAQHDCFLAVSSLVKPD